MKLYYNTVREIEKKMDSQGIQAAHANIYNIG